jgi:hypothetical protein
MRLFVLLFCSLVLGLGPVRASNIDLDQATKADLEGLWVVVPSSGGDVCADPDSQARMEIGFRENTGRVVLYPARLGIPDSLPIVRATRVGDSIELEFAPPAAIKFQLERADHLRVFAPMFSRSAGSADTKQVIRCKLPSHFVVAPSAEALLSKLTPILTVEGEHSGIGKFVEPRDGETDVQACASGGDSKGSAFLAPSSDHSFTGARWLHFEVLGPVNYSLIGFGFENMFTHLRVSSIAQTEDGALKLELKEYPLDDPRSEAGQSKPSTFTISFDGAHISIAELHATFVRCDPSNNPAETW